MSDKLRDEIAAGEKERKAMRLEILAYRETIRLLDLRLESTDRFQKERDELEEERRKDLADVERFRGMARTYMDERDALKKALANIVAADAPDAWHIAQAALAALQPER